MDFSKVAAATKIDVWVFDCALNPDPPKESLQAREKAYKLYLNACSHLIDTRSEEEKRIASVRNEELLEGITKAQSLEGAARAYLLAEVESTAEVAALQKMVEIYNRS